MKGDRYEVYRDKRRQYRWRFRAANGKIQATGGGDAYQNKRDCVEAITAIKASFDAPIVEAKA